MKKILLLCDGENFPKGAFDFIKQLRKAEPVTVKGIFFTPVDIEQMIHLSYVPVSGPYVKVKEREKSQVKKSQVHFTSECERNGIRHQVHEYEDAWNKDLLVKESRFADIALFSEKLFCRDVLNRQPNYFMEETLQHVECPVLIVPEEYNTIESITIAYDGSKEGLFALKQFCNLFPNLTDLPAEFAHTTKNMSDELPDQRLLLEYISCHFKSAFTRQIQLKLVSGFADWMDQKKNTLLISGSYSRSGVSNLLKKSFISEVIKKDSCPIFIAHGI
jgi:hypothetical protein